MAARGTCWAYAWQEAGRLAGQHVVPGARLKRCGPRQAWPSVGPAAGVVPDQISGRPAVRDMAWRNGLALYAVMNWVTRLIRDGVCTVDGLVVGVGRARMASASGGRLQTRTCPGGFSMGSGGWTDACSAARPPVTDRLYPQTGQEAGSHGHPGCAPRGSQVVLAGSSVAVATGSVRAGRVRPADAVEVGALEVGTRQVGARQVGVLHVSPLEGRVGQVGAG
jgi:hypothetical protein